MVKKGALLIRPFQLLPIDLARQTTPGATSPILVYWHWLVDRVKILTTIDHLDLPISGSQVVFLCKKGFLLSQPPRIDCQNLAHVNRHRWAHCWIVSLIQTDFLNGLQVRVLRLKMQVAMIIVIPGMRGMLPVSKLAMVWRLLQLLHSYDTSPPWRSA